jgi:hypothetical protein
VLKGIIAYLGGVVKGEDERVKILFIEMLPKGPENKTLK